MFRSCPLFLLWPHALRAVPGQGWVGIGSCLAPHPHLASIPMSRGPQKRWPVDSVSQLPRRPKRPKGASEGSREEGTGHQLAPHKRPAAWAGMRQLHPGHPSPRVTHRKGASGPGSGRRSRRLRLCSLVWDSGTRPDEVGTSHVAGPELLPGSGQRRATRDSVSPFEPSSIHSL